MKKITLLLSLLCFACLLLAAPAAAANISGAYDCTVENTNIYSGSNLYDIAPTGQYENSTATGITYVSGRYLYASGLSNTNAAGIATYTVSGIQGSTTKAADLGTSQGYLWDYGDGTTAQTTALTHRYSTPGNYTTTLYLSNALTESPVTLQTTVSLASSGAYDCTVENTNVYAKNSRYEITPTAYNKGGNTASGITNTAGQTLGFSWHSTVSGNTVSYTANIIGSTTAAADLGTTQINAIDYGDGTTAQNPAATVSHTYTAGIYSPGYTVGNYLTPEKTYYLAPIAIGIGTYTAQNITKQDFDFPVDATGLYQPVTQYVLPAANGDIEFFADDRIIVVSGRTVYTIDMGTGTAEPVSVSTGNTAETVYIGETAAIITDTNGNTGVYEYEENIFYYLSTGSSSHIATTANYAGIITGSTLTVYDLETNSKLNTTAAATPEGFAGNDNANTFAAYTNDTITYWWIDNNIIKSGTAGINQQITGLKQIPGTENYLVTTTANTHIISISETGEYASIMISDTELPLIHTQATTIGVIIGVHSPNEIIIVGADGSSAGNYLTGATLNDASIAKATGLYAITGGLDQQAYVLRKDQSSTWTLAQTIKANAALQHTQISTTGTYAALVSDINLYMLQLRTETAADYYLEGVIIASNGKPYIGSFTVNGEKVSTDANGKFTYPIYPGQLYRIVAEGTTTEYTATNEALQTIAIRLNPNPFAQSVSYSAVYNAETQNIEMVYTDTRDMTQTITWTIRETGTQEIVSTITTQPGQTAYWNVPLEQQYTNYQISMDAERQGTNVENTWMITPGGGNPIDIPGLDATGKNIIFGCVLMIFGGLFGVMHSTKGAILTVAVAGVMTYLGLLTIPWPIIMVAGTLAVAAALAKGGSGS